MSTERNKEIVRRYLEGDRDGRDNIAIWDEICDPNITLYASVIPEPVQGLEPLKQFTTAFHDGFSGFGITVEDMVAEDDRVAVRWTMHGQHAAPLPIPGQPPLPATGRQISVAGISFCKVMNGWLKEERVEADWMGMLQQLGVISSPGDQ